MVFLFFFSRIRNRYKYIYTEIPFLIQGEGRGEGGGGWGPVTFLCTNINAFLDIPILLYTYLYGKTLYIYTIYRRYLAAY